jgi:flagellar basal-body rod protein FlgB
LETDNVASPQQPRRASRDRIPLMDANNDLISMIADKMKYLNQRQSVLAENVANANTPGYQAKDLAPMSFGNALQQVSMTTTDPRDLVPPGMSGVNAKTVNTASFETLPTGNSVDLEQQMMQVSETSVNYQLMTSIYHQVTGWFRIAVKGS